MVPKDQHQRLSGSLHMCAQIQMCAHRRKHTHKECREKKMQSNQEGKPHCITFFLNIDGKSSRILNFKRHPFDVNGTPFPLRYIPLKYKFSYYYFQFITLFYFHIIGKISAFKRNITFYLGTKMYKHVICSIDNQRVRTEIKEKSSFILMKLS